MLKTISQYVLSFAARVSEQRTPISASDRLESIRSAMLDALFDIDQTNNLEDVWSAIVRAIEIQTLWYLRCDLLRQLASHWGEAVAREKLEEVTQLFHGVIAKNLIQLPKRSTQRSAKTSRAAPLTHAIAREFQNATEVKQEFTQVPNAASALLVVNKKPVVVDGLNFVTAIAAHRAWKARLSDYITSPSTSEKLEYRSVCRDNRCELGQWIHGSGGKDYGHLPVFNQLQIRHRQFHVEAGAIVRQVDKGNLKLAQTLLLHGDYSKYSLDVQELISALFVKVTDMKSDDVVI